MCHLNIWQKAMKMFKTIKAKLKVARDSDDTKI